jgi:hypothetical protein
MGPRAGLDTEATGKILLPLPGIEPRLPGRPFRSQTLYCLSYPAPRKHDNKLHVSKDLKGGGGDLFHRITSASIWNISDLSRKNRCTAEVRSLSLPSIHVCWVTSMLYLSVGVAFLVI